MKQTKEWVSLVIFVLGCVFQTQGWHDPTKSNNRSTAAPKASAANCAPATARTQLELNNVRALIETGGSMWQDRSTGSPAYEVPKGSGHTAIYSGSLWMGGKDFNGQLKIAAVMFRQGNDFWTGPLTTDGSAAADAATCLKYDKHFPVNRPEVEQFVAQWNCGFCDPGYTVPQSILEWPAHGDQSLGHDFYLAPFYDNPHGPNPNNGLYDPINDGDYPYYDLNNEIDCHVSREVYLKGDATLWWVFGDKGNIHTETGGEAIGMEIRAQAFAFTTNDEINNMTFYNYEMINRGTQTLFDTYFAQFVDADLGGSDDDYVGCDVQRGLGYCYNGDAFDEDLNGAIGYGSNPPAIGVDFFEGPYQDNDNKDNGIYDNVAEALADDGIVYPGIGLGYDDTIVDNERYGMRKFIYFNRDGNNPNITDPDIDQDFYNYMAGVWKDGSQMYYGGNAYDPQGSLGTSGIQCNYMFPGDSDPLNWGTQGVDPGASHTPWTEQTAGTNGNVPGDRRFMQSAGPFTLEPGAVNNITVGVVYGQGSSSDPFSSVEAMRLADDKAQLLFENCFRVVEGPDAPELTIQELDRELIVTISNPGGNNMNEDYESVDPTIPEENTFTVTNYVVDPNNPGSFLDSSFQQTEIYDRYYRFQGYQVFQLRDENVGPDELDDPDLAREVFQCDFKDSVAQLLNYLYDESIGATNAHEMVDGSDEGITHSFKVTDDLFAVGDRRIVNHKKYHFMVLAYGYNQYKEYDPDVASLLDGQKKPYLASRKSWDGGEIKTFTGIPHIPSPEAGGTIHTANYGDGPKITRIEGQGNGSAVLDLTWASESQIFQAPYKIDHPTYVAGKGPINVKVVDPLNVPADEFILRFNEGADGAAMQQADWVLINTTTGDSVHSDRTIEIGNEQIIPEYGISIHIEQTEYINIEDAYFQTELLEATIEFGDSSKPWLTGVPDSEGEVDQNWIRSGTVEAYDATNNPLGSSHPDKPATPAVFKDGEQSFESILGGTWAPYCIVAAEDPVNQPGVIINGEPGYNSSVQGFTELDDLQSVDIVITKDPSQWTRCIVVEMQEDPTLSKGNVDKFDLRADASVGKSGTDDGSGTMGMGWFPGYAVNLETGERLNMAFGENSWLGGENGRDMLWNPSSRMYSNTFESLFGGMHYVYVFSNERDDSGNQTLMPEYDEGAFAYDAITNGSEGQIRKVWRSCMWVGVPLLEEGQDFLSTDVRIRLRVGKPYDTYAVNGENTSYPQYTFGLGDLATTTEDLAAAEDALSLVNVVPNPYYAYSQYETNRLDNRVKITNLPDQCTIQIYNVSGTLIRTYQKDNPTITSLDWDLKNQAGVPIAGGVYLIHVNAPGVGETVVKWFGALRPVDLENF